MVFKKKNEFKTEEKKESKLTLDDLCGDVTSNTQDECDIAIALRTLRSAVRAGQIRCNRHPVTDVIFGVVMTKEEAEYRRNNGLLNRVNYASPLDELFFVDAEILKEEKIQSLKAKLANAQASQKQKVEEIEVLSKQLGEIE